MRKNERKMTTVIKARRKFVLPHIIPTDTAKDINKDTGIWDTKCTMIIRRRD